MLPKQQRVKRRLKPIVLPVAEELRRCRIEHAQRLLVDPEMFLMEDIAERAGFSSAGQMARVFAHFLGTSPSKYREDHTFKSK